MPLHTSPSHPLNFRFFNNLAGWTVFGLTGIAYTLAVEPTASFWDCGELIAASYKLQVPHPPGAPFFLLIGRAFSLLATDKDSVAFWVNMVSVLSSSLTTMFLYWSIVLLARKAGKIAEGAENTLQAILLIGSGLVGALALAFSDSFWFSAGEAEVYAMSSFFMAILFWAALKWAVIKEVQLENKWLILMAFLVGLSIGVHLLSLLVIPAVVLIWYFKKYSQTSLKGVILSMMAGLAIVGVIVAGIIPGLPSIAGWLEIFFVNKLALPFGSGIIFFCLLLLGGLIYALVYSQKRGMVRLNTALLCLSFILMGYSTYAVIIIRSGFDPPIDQNDPDNILSIVYYLKREQYGDRPLLYGNYFDAEVQAYEKKQAVYRRRADQYEIAYHKQDYQFREEDKTFFPRAYSIQPAHKPLYRQLMGLGPNEKPNFWNNLDYLFTFQLGHMYWRYFLWNFAGRESDIKEAGWLKPADAFEKELPELLKRNKGRNNFLMLPLLLGIAGAIFHFRRDPKGFGVVALLFFMTGLGLVLYLNSPPTEPRERDYIYVGSFYAFSVWIGFGFFALASSFSRIRKQQSVQLALIAGILCLVVPGMMASEGWDDHNRSERFLSLDSARNTLASCAPNAILFTGGDNDTYPLWYAQEVEDFRTDVRVIVLTYFNAAWYIEQMTRKVNESEALPFSLSEQHYRQGGLNDVLYYVENKNVKGALPLKQYLKLLKENHPALRVSLQSEEFNTLPAKTMALNVDKAAVLAKGIIPQEKEALLTDQMIFPLKKDKQVLYKSDLMMLDLISTNDWERPIYFNNTSLQSLNFDLSQYVVNEGTAYRLLPLRLQDPQMEQVNTDIMYDNLMNKFYFRGLDNPDVYFSESYRGQVLNLRSAFNTLAQALLMEGKTEKARKVLKRSLEEMPDQAVPYDISAALSLPLLLAVGEQEKALEIANLLGRRADKTLGYLSRENKQIGNELQTNLVILSQLSRSMAAAGLQDKAREYQQLLGKYYGG